jgi:hypothetical protein
MKYISKIGAYNYPGKVEIKRVMHNYYNPDLILFRWPNGEGLWLEKHEWEKID